LRRAAAARATFNEVTTRAEKLAAALTRLGIAEGDRVGTFCWNNQGHLEAYLAIPAMGAVLHTLNIRLPAEQLAYVINHAEDRCIIVDASLIPLLAAIKDDLKTVETIIVVGEGDTSALGETLSYERLLAAEEPGLRLARPRRAFRRGHVLHERHHRQPQGRRVLAPLHLAAHHGRAGGLLGRHDRGGPHPHHRADVPRQRLGHPVRGLDGRYRHDHAPDVPDGAAAWPTSSTSSTRRWPAACRPSGTACSALDTPVDFSSVRGITAGGAAVPQSLIEAFEERFGATIIQGWGMTETSPLAAFGLPPGAPPRRHDDMYYKIKAGRVVAGVEVRVVAEDGTILPNDGKSVGEFEIRGPWVTGSYYKDEDPAKFHDGWLRTGDVGTLDSRAT
jgi:fatty-acyl-CoA synthase